MIIINLVSMKKLILLLLIPIFTYSQYYDELMGIESLNDFKKVMIENGYEMDYEDERRVVFGYNLVRKVGETNKSEKWGIYYKDSKIMIYQFNETPLNILTRYGDYDDIVDNIKSKCEYDDIIVVEDESGVLKSEYVGYICSESKLDGNFGFMVSEGNGYVQFFPNN